MEYIARLALRLPAILLAIAVHELAHAATALKLGDDSGRRQGRLSLNPLVHLDPIGTVGFVIGGFGWGRPVPCDPRALRHPRAAVAVALAGPASNLALAALAAAGLHLLELAAPGTLSLRGGFASQLLFTVVHVNLVLCLFNFLPIFPLDGARMADSLLPADKAYAFKRINETWGMPLLFVLIAVGVVSDVSPLGLLFDAPVAYLTRVLLFL